MEQKIMFVIGAIGTIMINLISNSIYDKVKSHSSIRSRKSDYEFEFTLLSIKFKKK